MVPLIVLPYFSWSIFQPPSAPTWRKANSSMWFSTLFTERVALILYLWKSEQMITFQIWFLEEILGQDENFSTHSHTMCNYSKSCLEYWTHLHCICLLQYSIYPFYCLLNVKKNFKLIDLFSFLSLSTICGSFKEKTYFGL